jgi:hypothetical protein
MPCAIHGDAASRTVPQPRTGGGPAPLASRSDASDPGTVKMVRQSRHVQHVSRWIHVPCSNTPEEISDADPHSEHTICSLTRRASATWASPIKPTEVESDHCQRNIGRCDCARGMTVGSLMAGSHDNDQGAESRTRQPSVPLLGAEAPGPSTVGRQLRHDGSWLSSKRPRGEPD